MIRRAAICTLAAPWEGLPLLGGYWPRIVKGFAAQGVHAEVFYLSMKMPPILPRFSAKMRRFSDRPDEYQYEGARFHTIRGYFPPPVPLRYKGSTYAPRLAAWTIRRAVQSTLLRKLREFNPDALLFHDGILLSQLGLATADRLGVPWAVIEHDPIDLPASSRLGMYYADMLNRATVSFAVHAPSVRYMRQELGIRNARVVHNGTTFPTEAQRQTPKPPKWRDRKIVLHCGNHIARKAHLETIRAFAAVAHPDSALVFIGSAPKGALELAASLGITDRVEFVGPMPQREVLQHMIWADVFVLPAWWEAFGMVYTEAMASETPVIMCADCGLADYITPGVHGWVIPPRNQDAITSALREALHHADLPAMGRAGRILTESRWTWENNAATLLKGLNGEAEADPLLLDPALVPVAARNLGASSEVETKLPQPDAPLVQTPRAIAPAEHPPSAVAPY